MKGYTLAAGLILAAASAMGQAPPPTTTDERPCISNTVSYTPANIPRAKKGFLGTLQTDNDGVMESCLAHVAQMRIMLPQEDMKDIEATVNRIVSNGWTPAIRYKAYLASQVFASPETFRGVAAASYESSDAFFAAIAGRLQQTILGYGGK